MTLLGRFPKLLASLALCSLGVSAQPAPKSDASHARALWVSGGELRGVELLVGFPNGGTQTISPSFNRRSAAWIIKESGRPFVFLARPQAASAAVGTDAPPPVKIGEVAWPSQASRDYLLILAGQAGASGQAPRVRGVAVPDGFDVFPPHTIRAVNLTAQPMFLRVGSKVETIGPGLSAPIPYGAVAAEGEKSVPLFPIAIARSVSGGGGDVFYTGKAEGYRSSRLLLVVSNSTQPDAAPQVQSVLDFEPRPALVGPPSKPGR